MKNQTEWNISQRRKTKKVSLAEAKTSAKVSDLSSTAARVLLDSIIFSLHISVMRNEEISNGELIYNFK